MNEPTIRLKTLRQMLNADPEPFCPSPAYVSYTAALVKEGLAEPAKMRRGFYLNADGKRELTRLEAEWRAVKRRAA